MYRFNVTGRAVGQLFNHIITQVRLSKKLRDDVVANYKTRTEDHRIIKYTVILMKSEARLKKMHRDSS
ncbi:PAS domain-containing protein [Aneurinibacillus migulanus]|uniref:PAS domain-containing protein n=1 Tax=Aneurinibacillus migulanus TaxID=47500 RepID=UPI0009BAA9E9|nr:PAS domain-containing protein [Aneurinibacillus migulanus]MED0890754.1 PAS domain-containing protein [Aneurinibacillus migulanus]MED1618293.1 PAS domain-containing protein [Aneurinibacillus migulanus]